MLKNLLGFFSSNKEVDEGPTFEENFYEADQYLLQALAPDYIAEGEDYVQLGSNYTRTLIVMDFQTVLSRESIRNLSEINSNVSITTFFTKMSNSIIRKEMAKAIKQNRIRQADSQLDDATKVEAEYQSNDARRVILEMASGNEQMYNGHLLIHINARDKEELARLTQNVKSIVGSIGTAYNPNKKAMDAFNSFLPLASNSVSDLSSRLMNSEAVSFFFPFHENEMFDEHGDFIGINEKTKNVILVDSNKLLNKHKFYIGVSGVGKSTAAFNDLVKDYQAGVSIYVNDPKGEFGSVFKNMGGQWVKFDMAGTSRINAFDLPTKQKTMIDDDIELTENPIFNKIPILLVRFKLMFPKMDMTQYNIISGLLEKTYAKVGINENTDFSQLTNEDYPTMTTFNEVIEELKEKDIQTYEYIREFHLAIQIYTTGIYSKLFNGYTNVDTESDLISYDTLAFQQNEEVQRIIYYDVMAHLTNLAINGDGRPLRFFFDEGHVIADPKIPVAMQQLFFMMKVLRSFNVGVSIATQSINDFLSAKDDKRNYGEAVINQSIQCLYLPIKKAEIDFIERELGQNFSVKERAILTVREGEKEKQAGKGILVVGSKKIQCHIQLNDVEKALWFEKKHYSEITV
ncbi:TrsE [Solibacillus sp. FSL W7-1436]|uniref:VirB4 family type IV secretion system protein n=1 Tax=Solibacillus sp. FSL W7-1436 TaxID=2921705 RepID=UPI0030F5FBF9